MTRGPPATDRRHPPASAGRRLARCHCFLGFAPSAPGSEYLRHREGRPAQLCHNNSIGLSPFRGRRPFLARHIFPRLRTAVRHQPFPATACWQSREPDALRPALLDGAGLDPVSLGLAPTRPLPLVPLWSARLPLKPAPPQAHQFGLAPRRALSARSHSPATPGPLV